MTTIFTPTESKRFFVGRETERQIFAEMLDGRRNEWIIHVPGDGGIGKTRLLETLRDDSKAREGVLVTQELVDFYQVANQISFGLLQEIANQLNPDLFGAFTEERRHFDRLLNTEPEPAQRQEWATGVTEAFLKDYTRLLRDDCRIVWLLDTCEEMRGVEQFFLKELLPRIAEIEQNLHLEIYGECDEELRRRTVVVIAGRKQLDFPAELAEQVVVCHLQPLTMEQMREFFEVGGEEVEASRLRSLYELTSGRPLYVALSYDWLRNEVGTWEQLLSLEEPFGQKLVGWVRRLDTLEKQAILYTALAWRRMEPSLLGRLLGVSGDEAQGVIEQLSRFSFVKYRPAINGFPGAFQLHDEMRDLVVRNVAPQEGQITMNSLLQEVVNWYQERIDDQELLEGQKLPSRGSQPDEARALLAEWLYYECRRDLNYAFAIQERLFRHSVHYLDLAFCDLLNQEMERFAPQFTQEQRDVMRFREALVAFRKEDYMYASSIWHSLVRRDEVERRQQATTLMMLVEIDSYTGKPGEALVHAEESERSYKLLMDKTTDDLERELLQSELGQLYNNWGYAYRVKEDFDKAIEYYQKALEQGGRDKNIARTLNNMGYIYFQKGDIVQARTLVGRALQLRRELDVPYELGLGYNTMGIIMEESGRIDEASDSYRKALLSFEAARSERGQALVLLNQGHIARTTNQFEQAFEYLHKAKMVFDQKGDKDNLIKVINEQGCIYRQRNQEGDWEKAEALLKESLALSVEMEKPFAQADNLEDLCILYTHMTSKKWQIRDQVKANEYASVARQAAEQVEVLARKHGYTYLLAKTERSYGDLAYGEKDYDQAFNHYFEACRQMGRAKVEGRMTPVLSQRRYEEMVDRLQEHLQTLPSLAETQKYAGIMLDKYAALSSEEQEQLKSLKDFLDAATRVAQLTSKAGKSETSL